MLRDYHLQVEAAQACNFSSSLPDSWECQTFTPFNTYSATSLALKGYRSVGTTGTITVSIRATSGGLPTGEDLAYGTINAANMGTSSPGNWHTITLNTGVSLVEGTRYAIVIRCFFLASGNVYFRTSSTTNYAFGAWGYSNNAGIDWEDYAGNTANVVFKIYDDSSFTPQLVVIAGNVSGGNHLWKVLDDGDSLTLVSSYGLDGNVNCMAFSASSRRLYVGIETSIYCYNIDSMTLITSWGSNGSVNIGATVLGLDVNPGYPTSGYQDYLAVTHSLSDGNYFNLLDDDGSVVWQSTIQIVRASFDLSGNIHVSNASIKPTGYLLDYTNGAILYTYFTAPVSGYSSTGITRDEEDDVRCYYLTQYSLTQLYCYAGSSQQWVKNITGTTCADVLHLSEVDLVIVAKSTSLQGYYDIDGSTHPYGLYTPINNTVTTGSITKLTKNGKEFYFVDSNGGLGVAGPSFSYRNYEDFSGATLTSVIHTGSAYSAPVITDQDPTGNTDAEYGDTIIFSVTATGNPEPTYQWHKDDSSMSGEISNTLTLSSVDVTDGGTYYCIATNVAGSDQSEDVILRIVPYITSQSSDSSFTLGQPASISVVAEGTPPLSYQWYKNDILLSGETNAVFSTFMKSSDAGTYKCLVSNDAGSVWSNPIVLIAVSNPYSYNLFNIPLDINRES